MKSRWLTFAAVAVLVVHCGPPEAGVDRPDPLGDNGRDVPTARPDNPTVDVVERDMPTVDVRIMRDIPDLDIPDFDATVQPFDMPTVDMPTADRPNADSAAVDAQGMDAAVDAPPVDVVARDVRVQPGSQPAGAECIDNSDCRMGLGCDTSVRNGFCTARCMNGNAIAEQAACGGAGSTCVTNGDPPAANSFCGQVCIPGPGPGCREGQVCTGFWVSHAGGRPDSPACVPFCQRDLECPAGEVCQTRLGDCGMDRVNPMLLADGQPCMRPAMGAASPCRGVCFNVLNGSPIGVCGSLIDLAIRPDCPDGPATPPLSVMNDNLAYCVFRRCGGMNGCCPAGLVCEGNGAGAMTGFCTADDPMVANIPCP